jgi:hypothetical protein
MWASPVIFMYVTAQSKQRPIVKNRPIWRLSYQKLQTDICIYKLLVFISFE